MKNFMRAVLAWTIVYAIMPGKAECKGLEPILSFSANEAVRTAAEGKLVPGRSGSASAVYLSGNARLSIPIENFNPQEGTLSFWFLSDWSVPNYTEHFLFEITAAPDYKMLFRKGWNAPDYCHLLMGAGGPDVGHYPSSNLFTGRVWRHYAVRWSTERRTAQLVVDGDIGGQGQGERKGKFKYEVTGLVKAALVFTGSARGAFDEVKVFDRYLELGELIETAGLKKVSHYLQRQMPPPGGEESYEASGPVSYVNSATGEKVNLPASKDEGGKTSVYNPANMPQLRETEHTKWARPLAGGSVRALMVMPTGFYDESSNLRDAAEIWQRLDINCDVTEKAVPAVLEKDYDVIVVTQQNSRGVERGWKNIDEDLRKWILGRVKSGKSGLVYTYPNRLDDEINSVFAPGKKISSDVVLRGFPVAAMHRANSGGWQNPYDKVYDLDESYFETPDGLNKVVNVYNDHTTRAVRFDYEPIYWEGCTPATYVNAAATDVHYDYWMALLARAMLFAAGREPAARITGAEIATDQWSITIEGQSAPAQIWYRARDIWGRVYLPDTVVKIKDSGIILLKGANLPPRAVVDFILKDDKGRVLDWYSQAAAPATESKISGITLDKEFYEKRDAVQGTIDLVSKSPGKCRLEVYLADHAGRRLVRTEIQPVFNAEGNAKARFSLLLPDSSESLIMRVDALLLQDKKILDTHSADCPVPDKEFKGFYSIIYGHGSNRFQDRQKRKIFRDDYGADALGSGGSRKVLANWAKENMRGVEYLADLGYVDDEAALSAFMEPWDEFFTKKVYNDPKKVMRFRPIFYSLGEEHYMGLASTQNPAVNALFRENMREQYGRIEDLNAVWGTKYTSWDEVQMLTPSFDSRRFMEKLFADKHAYLAERFRKIDPYAEVGIHCGWDLWMGRGYDYWFLSKALDSMIGYRGPQNQYIRSFFKNSYGCWYHYDIGSQYEVCWQPWEMLISGAHGFALHTTDSSNYGVTTSDLHLSSDFAASAPEFKDAGDAGDLLVRTEYIQDQVAIHYSQDSFQTGVSNLTWIHASFINLLFDAGVPFRFVSYEQVANGELLAKKYPLFILPHSVSLSPAEVKAIREYVQNGGVIWADVEPGQIDNHGRRLEQSQVADFFTNMQRLMPGKNYWVKEIGKGKTISADIGNYSYDRNAGDYLKTQELLDAIVGVAGLKRAARVVNFTDKKLANGVWTSGYRSGGQRYVVVAKDYSLADRAAADVEIEFAVKGHIYEMRSGQYFGYADKVRTLLETARGKVFSVLPYRVKEITAAQKSRAERGQDLVLEVNLAVEGTVGKDDLHLLRVSVTAPDGKEIMSLRRMALIYGGAGLVRIPVTYDDAPGAWTVHLKDSATGIRKDMSFTLGI